MITLASLLLGFQIIAAKDLYPARTLDRMFNTSYPARFAISQVNPDKTDRPASLSKETETESSSGRPNGIVPIDNKGIPYLVDAMCAYKRNTSSSSESTLIRFVLELTTPGADPRNTVLVYFSPTRRIRSGDIYEAAIAGRRVDAVLNSLHSYAYNKRWKELIGTLRRRLSGC